MSLALSLVVALGVAGCDQATKLHAVRTLTDATANAAGAWDGLGRLLDARHPRPVRQVTVVDGLWRLRYAENTGAAFSMFAQPRDEGRHSALVVLPLAGILLAGLWLWRARPEDRLARLGLALFIGGGVGNLLDRVRLHYVVDFIQWHWHDRVAWPTFNIADAAVLVGAALILIAQGRKRATGTPRDSSPRDSHAPAQA